MPGVSEAWVVKNGFVGERFQEFDEVFFFVRRKFEALYERVFVWVVVAASGVVIENGIERGKASVVHVRRGDGDVAQGGRFEFTFLRREAGVVEFRLIGRAIR